MEFNRERVQLNVRKAATIDLLDRATVFRADLEPQALPLILEELRSRGITPEAIVAHEESRRRNVYMVEGTVRVCNRCRLPAVTRQWGWHKLFDRIPLFPRVFYLCETHQLHRES